MYCISVYYVSAATDKPNPTTNLQEFTMNDQQIEQEIQEKGLTAPRVTPERINEVIVNEQYHVFEGTTLTVC